MAMDNSSQKLCKCGAEFSSSNGRAVCMECLCTQHNREPGHRQADPVYRPGRGSTRPIEGAPIGEPRTYGVRLAEGFAMLGGACC